MADDSPLCAFTIPDRRGSMTGSEFAKTLTHVPSGPARELAIYQQFELGNVPDFMRTPKRLSMPGSAVVLELDILPDVLCVGTDDDFVRVPMNPHTAQRIADLFSASLITPFISDQIWTQADVRINPMSVLMPPTAEMTSTQWFVDQNAKIEHVRAGRGGLIAGHKKDVVIANALALPEFQDRVAIYGWHQTNGVPIQGLNPSKGIPPSHTHVSTYADYSHGVRLVAQDVVRDGADYDLSEIMEDEELAALVNGASGVLTFTRYTTA
jgi:hypothetical protein